MASTVQGSVGAANAGAIVTAILLSGVGGRPNLNGTPTAVVTSDVAAASTGNFSLGGLAVGTYQIKAVLANGNISRQAGSDVTNVLFVNTITVDGSTTYHL